uniref:C2H2-type domain-containing protein n=1 Tax=Oryzias sinensis TaxID=183150 RepID=A0A8C7ZNB5_9TELE
MSVLSSRALQEQLSVIMGALTKAAVVEICELVNEGYAVLQMEISRSHKENEDLKKKLQLIESIVVRGSCGPLAAAEGMEPAPSVDKVMKPDASPRERDGVRGDAAAASGGHGGAAGAEREQTVTPRTAHLAEHAAHAGLLPEVVLIKDEDSDSNDTEDEGDRASADRSAARGGATSTTISRKRRRSCRTEDSEELSDQMDVMSSPPAAQAKLPVYTLDGPTGEPGCSSQLVEGVSADGGESACSFSSQMYFSSSTLMEAQSPSSRAELDLSVDSVWSKQPKGPVAFGTFVPNDSGDAFGLKVVSISGSSPADGQLSDSRSSVYECDAGAVNFGLYGDQSGPPQLLAGQPGAGVHRKRFICSMCNKTYASAQNLEVHMRIHTGERPFSCSQCGKKFTQSAHLKSHQNVHTGERPYTCKLCSKSFMIKYSLKLHAKKSHPSNWTPPAQTGQTSL